jgi:hypothetical protein
VFFSQFSGFSCWPFIVASAIRNMTVSAAISISRRVTSSRFDSPGDEYVVTFDTGRVEKMTPTAGNRCDKCLRHIHDGVCRLRYAAHSE